MTAAPPRFAELNAPAHWRVVDFISDLHLQAIEPLTVQAWAHYLAHTPANAVFILGDLFEVWVGDDALDANDASARFEQQCMATLQAAAARRAVYFMAGNRDFLLGPAAADRAGMTLLDDPTVLVFGARRWLLSHGDALCLDDREYQQFRAQARTPAWQQAFLSRPLTERRAYASALRQQSEARKHSGAPYADVDLPLCQDWLARADTPVLIHGHTHRPADHALDHGGLRHVLSDWDLSAQPPRAEVLRLSWPGSAEPVRVQRLLTGTP